MLELFAQGNIVLCDHSWTVLTLLRSHRDDAQNLAIMPRHVYPLGATRPFSRTEAATIVQALSTSSTVGDDASSTAPPTDDAATTRVEQQSSAKAGGKRRGGQQNAANDKSVVLGALNATLPYGPALLEHCLAMAGVAPTTPCPLASQPARDVADAVTAFETWFEGVAAAAAAADAKDGGGAPPPPKGYLRGKVTTAPPSEAGESSTTTSSAITWDEFWPFEPYSVSDAAIVTRECPSFDVAVDTFFGSAEILRSSNARLAAETAARSKVERMRHDQAARAAALEAEAAAQEGHASLIEYNLSAVDAALKAVNDALATGMDWPSLQRLVKDERRAGNPVAGMITAMDFAKGTITLLLGNVLDWEDEDDGEAGDAARSRPASTVTVRLDLSAAANAREMHASRKKHQFKAAKTMEAAAQTLSAAERKAAAAVAAARAGALASGTPGSAVTVMRSPCWWEKYAWFITSENALVLSGRDPGQTAILLRRHLNPGDAVVTSDVAGAPLCIVKSPPPPPPISSAGDDSGGTPSAVNEQIGSLPPPLSLHQAGTWCVCRSAAWGGKFSSSGWWAPATSVVTPAQQQQTQQLVQLPGAPAGWGVIRGARRELPPSQLVLGFGLMFRLDSPDCVSRHMGERCIRSVQESDEVEAAAARLDDSTLEEELAGIDGQGEQEEEEEEEEDAEPVEEEERPDGDHTADTEAEQDEQQEEGFSDADDAEADTQQTESSGTTTSSNAGARAAQSPRGKGAAAMPVSQPNVPRGKNKKLKKLRDKYGDQDEEDRALAMAALASAGKSKKQVAQEAEAARKAAAAQEAQRRAEARAASASARSAGGGGGKGQRKSSGKFHEAAASETVNDGHHAADVPDDGDGDDGAASQSAHSMRTSLLELHALTGIPRSDDVLSWAVPVCAPYAALASFKFKAKVTPGSTKKGRAAKQGLEAFARAVVASPRERELAHAVSDVDGVTALCTPAGVKLSFATLGKLGPPLTAGGKAKQQPVKKTQRGQKSNK